MLFGQDLTYQNTKYSLNFGADTQLVVFKDKWLLVLIRLLVLQITILVLLQVQPAVPIPIYTILLLVIEAVGRITAVPQG